VFKEFIERLALQLKEPLPGENAQLLMGSDRRLKDFNFMPMNDTTRKSAVMILLYPFNNSIYSVFILRPEYEGTHSGQIAFPGGKYENADLDLETTALRETAEEIGIDISKVTVIGKLSQLFIPPSNFVVFPLVGYVNEKPVFKPDANEVKEIIEYQINVLLKKETVKTMEFMVRDNMKFIAPYFDVDGYVVWGATAMILSEFVEILRNVV
jgi:8-oxo-dGTP pyrophosphatase MutT (NUDIX family)